MTKGVVDAWFTSGLPGAGCHQYETYCLLSMEAVPAVEPPMPPWSWVPRFEKALDWSIGGQDPEDGNLFLARATAAGLQLPNSLRAFIQRPELTNGIRSGTGCWWSLDPNSIAIDEATGRHLVRFLNDQQEVLFWYLLVDGSADPPIVASFRDFTFRDPDPPPVPNDIWRCAPTFHTFMYRYWLENEIVFRTAAQERLTPEQAMYLADAQRLHSESARIDVTFPDPD